LRPSKYPGPEDRVSQDKTLRNIEKMEILEFLGLTRMLSVVYLEFNLS